MSHPTISSWCKGMPAKLSLQQQCCLEAPTPVQQADHLSWHRAPDLCAICDAAAVLSRSPQRKSRPAPAAHCLRQAGHVPHLASASLAVKMLPFLAHALLEVEMHVSLLQASEMLAVRARQGQPGNA